MYDVLVRFGSGSPSGGGCNSLKSIRTSPASCHVLLTSNLVIAKPYA